MGTAILAKQLPATVLKSSVITLDNIGVSGVATMVKFSDGTSLNLPAESLDFLIIGNLEAGGSAYGNYNLGVNNPHPSLTFPNRLFRDTYWYQGRPQYKDLTVADIINVKDHGAKGDGVSDDTSAIAAVLKLATTSNLIYFPAGSYLITCKSVSLQLILYINESPQIGGS